MGKLPSFQSGLAFPQPHWKEAMFSCGASLLPGVIDPQKIPTKTRPDVASSSSSSPGALLLLPATSQK